MLYDSPDDNLTRYEYARAYGLLNDYDHDDLSSYDLEDDHNELLEVNWETPR